MVHRMLQELFDGKELCKSVNPDEAAAYGASVMATKLSGHNDKGSVIFCYRTSILCERAKSNINHLLGELRVFEVPLAPKPWVKVCFEIDPNGILTVTSELLSSHKRQKLTITNVNGRLLKKEIQKMLKDCEQYQNEDKEFKMKAEAHYELDNLIYDMKKKIKEHNIKTRMRPESLIKMENVIAEMTQWLHDNKDVSYQGTNFNHTIIFI
ncbi:putative heat shock protein 70 family protein [Tanacetum coccineum]